VQHDLAFGGGATVILVDGDRDTGLGADGFEVSNDLRHQPTEGRPNLSVGQPPSRGLRNADRLRLLDDDVLQLHDVAPFKCAEVRFDPPEALLFLSDRMLDLRPAQPQHSAKLLDRDLLAEERPDLLQPEADIAQGHDSVHSPQLVNAVEAVATVRVDPLGREQAKLVVVAQHAGRHLRQPGELSDVQHDQPVIRLHTV
jgi:hypothetical protein